MGRFAAIMFGLILNLLMPSGARADWYDGAWSYRRVIQVTNNGTDALTDYATAVNLQSATFDFSHAAADGPDLLGLFLRAVGSAGAFRRFHVRYNFG
jgi:hypothetical protein